jgi:hypothetical protein
MRYPGAVLALKPLYLALRERRRRRVRAEPDTAISARIRSLALWSASLTSILAPVSLISELGVRIGAVPAPWNGFLFSGPQLLLVPAFLMLVLCLDHVVPHRHRLMGNFAVAFALLYAVLVPMVSILFAISLIDSETRAGGQQAVLAPGSFVLVLDGLGRVYMCVSAMFAGLAFAGSGLRAALRWLGIINGVIGAAILAECFGYPSVLTRAWAISMCTFALISVEFFRRLRPQQ